MSELSYVFPFHEDEIYFSWIARYHRFSVNRTSDITSEQIFGRVPNIRPDRLFLLNRFCEATGFDPEDIIQNHSTLPYFRSSFSPDKYQTLIRRVKEKAKTKYPVYGVGVSQQYMKYCPVCAKEETEKYGAPYWHVSHNLDGITICPKHHVKLLNDTTPFTSRRRTYALPPYTEGDPAVIEDDTDELRFNALIDASWRVETYSKQEILTLIRTLARSQCQAFDSYQWLCSQIPNNPNVLKLANNRGITQEDLAHRIERLLKDKRVAYHPFYTYLIRDFLGLTKEVAEKIVEAYPGIFESNK